MTPSEALAEVLKHAENLVPLAREVIDEHATRVFRIAGDTQKDLVELTAADAPAMAKVIAAYIAMQRGKPGQAVHCAPEYFEERMGVPKKVAFTSVFILQGPEPRLFEKEAVDGENKFHVLTDKIEAEGQRAALKAKSQTTFNWKASGQPN